MNFSNKKLFKINTKKIQIFMLIIA